MEFLLALFMSFFGFESSSATISSTPLTPVVSQETIGKTPQDRQRSSGKGDLIIVFEDLDLRTTKEKMLFSFQRVEKLELGRGSERDSSDLNES